VFSPPRSRTVNVCGVADVSFWSLSPARAWLGDTSEESADEVLPLAPSLAGSNGFYSRFEPGSPSTVIRGLQCPERLLGRILRHQTRRHRHTCHRRYACQDAETGAEHIHSLSDLLKHQSQTIEYGPGGVRDSLAQLAITTATFAQLCPHCQRIRLVLARSITSSPRPLSTARIM
jgi:hypothetical protein